MNWKLTNEKQVLLLNRKNWEEYNIETDSLNERSSVQIQYIMPSVNLV